MPRPAVLYTVVGDGPNAPSPIERPAISATEAEQHLHSLMRLCGKRGKVVVWSKEGRAIDPRRLAALARAEIAEPGADLPPAAPRAIG